MIDGADFNMEKTQRKNSVDSLVSNDTFEGEMDNFIEELLKKGTSVSKKEIEEDNISEEKVKRELQENEKADREAPEVEEQRSKRSGVSEAVDEQRARRSGVSEEDSDSDRWSSSPEPEPEPAALSGVEIAAVEPLSPRAAAVAPPGEEGGGGREQAERDGVADPSRMGSERSPSRAAAAAEDGAYAEEDFPEEDYVPTEDQRKAMLELQQMKLDLQDVGFSDEDPPEYDVAERVRQLNEQLANEPTPHDDERERSIKFKDDLVDLVAPPPDYPSDDEEAASASPAAAAAAAGGGGDRGGGGVNDLLAGMKISDPPGDSGDSAPSRATPTDAPPPPPPPPPPGASSSSSAAPGNPGAASTTRSIQPKPHSNASATRTDSGHGEPKKAAVRPAAGGGGDSEEVLVERDGTFELVKASELTAEEREIFLPPPPEDDDDDGTTGGGGLHGARGPISGEEVMEDLPDSSRALQPTPPREPRPSTASAAPYRRAVVGPPRRRVQSAAPSRPTNQPLRLNSSYQSPYALSAEEKRIGARQQRERQERERQEQELKRLEEQQRHRENNEAFVAWLRQKRTQSAWRRDSPQEEQGEGRTTEKSREKVHSDDESSQDREAEAAFKEWLKGKRTQQRRERQVEEERRREEDQGWIERPRQECDKAFRQYVFQEWLKKKSQETKKAKKQEATRARISKLLVRRTRKAMQLARAIRQSQSFRYVDYYGYRY